MTLSGETDEQDGPGEGSTIYCLVSAESSLHARLRHHFRDDAHIEVLADARRRERRSGIDRRSRPADAPSGSERRRIRNSAGRRVGERRAALLLIEPPQLPGWVRRSAGQISFVTRLAPSAAHAEDLDTARLVTRIQAGDREAFPVLYDRYFDRVHGYLRIVLRDAHDAEDATQQVFARLFERISDYERREEPFRAWLFAVVRNTGLKRLRQRRRLELIEDLKEEHLLRTEAERSVGWISDPELVLFVERLPLPQRQVLLLRFLFDLNHREIGAILARREDDVRALQYRALRFLRSRLAAVGHGSRDGGPIAMLPVPEEAGKPRSRPSSDPDSSATS